MNDIIRVFPRRTSLTPRDELAFVGDPPMLRPPADEVHISVAFTWDIPQARRLAEAWRQYYSVVKIGGPAFDDPCDGFTPNVYVRSGVTFTSRGCNHNCPWCFVPKREGKVRLLEPTEPGHIVQDNNFLQTGRPHMARVFAMLRRVNRPASFSGGLEAALVDDWVAEELRDIKIASVFLAADTEGALKPLEIAVKRLNFLPRKKLRCYVLLAFNGETVDKALARLLRVWRLGCLPFAQLYQPPDKYISYSKEWKDVARTWSRPAAMKTLMKQVGAVG